MNKIELLQFTVTEPVSALTDVITGVVSLFVAYKLIQGRNEKARHFINYFVLMGLSTIIAGTVGHAFQFYLTPNWKVIGWSLSAVALFFFQLASIQLFKNRLSSNMYFGLLFVSYTQVFLLNTLLFFPETRIFKVVQLNLTIGYLGILIPLYIVAFFKWKIESSKRLFTAIAVAGLASLSFNFKLSLHQWFDHNVVSHIFITGFIVLMYTAVLKLIDTSAEKELKNEVQVV
jgi:hypothetical protein